MSLTAELFHLCKTLLSSYCPPQRCWLSINANSTVGWDLWLEEEATKPAQGLGGSQIFQETNPTAEMSDCTQKLC